MKPMTKVGKEYGTALFMLACEEGTKSEYADALQKVKTVFTENPDYMSFLTSPSVSLGERISAIQSAFGGVIPENVVSFLQLLCEKGRMSSFFQSADEFRALLDASEHVSTAVITSAIELTDAEKEKLVSKLEGICKAKVEAEYRIDENLLGGLIVEIDGNVMDGSLKHRLREVKEVMNT